MAGAAKQTLLVSSLLSALLFSPSSYAQPAGQPFSLSGWLLSKDPLAELERWLPLLDEVSSQLFILGKGGKVQWLGGDETRQWAKELSSLVTKTGKRLVPHILSSFEEPELVTEIVKDEAARYGHIEQLINLLIDPEIKFDGIEIDYEGLAPADRENFLTFIKELNFRLKNMNPPRRLNVDIPLVYLAGNRSQAFDYKGLAENADLVKLLGYDLRWNGLPSLPGVMAHAPLWWIDNSLEVLAQMGVNLNKVVLGVPLYGYIWDKGGEYWSTSADRAVYYRDLTKSAEKIDIDLKETKFYFDETSRTPFAITRKLNGNEERQIWFEDATSTAWKADLARRHNLAGLAFWRINGREDPGTASVVERFLAEPAELKLKVTPALTPVTIGPDGKQTPELTLRRPYFGTYRVRLQGRRESTFEMTAELHRKNEPASVAQITGSASPTEPVEWLLKIEPGPSSELVSLWPPDKIPPVSNLFLQGKEIAPLTFEKQVTVIMAGQDNPGGSGLKRLEYSLDGGPESLRDWKPYLGPFRLTTPGQFTLLYRALDWAGNGEPAKEIRFSVQ